MDDEIKEYKEQLVQVNLALVSDPDSLELLRLKADLEELIQLSESLHTEPVGKSAAAPVKSATAQASTPDGTAHEPRSLANASPLPIKTNVSLKNIAAAAAPASPQSAQKGPRAEAGPVPAFVAATLSASAKVPTRWAVGDVVAVLRPDNGTLCAAQVKGLPDSANYTISLLGETGESIGVDLTLPASSVKHASELGLRTQSSARAAGVRKKRKNMPPLAYQAKQAKRQARLDQVDHAHSLSQKSWLNFASGGRGKAGGTTASSSATPSMAAPVYSPATRTSKRRAIASSILPVTILEKKSMFSTPDNPNAKVGVIGSGMGMTDFGDRGRHKFDFDSR